MNIKKMFTALSAMVVAVTMTMPSASVFAATYSEELQGAYDWAYSKWVTTMSSIDNANMYGAITRAEMAKMLSVYATEVLGYTADTSKACTFSDIDSVKGDLHDYIIESCQLGLMGQGITAFRPYDTISRAEFGTALSRTLWGNEYEGGTPYYAKHLDALKAAGIMNQIANAESTKEIRGYVMLMLQRSEENGAGVDCDDTDVVLACLEDLDNCPAACKADYEDEGETSDEVVKSGSLSVTAEAATNRKVVIGGVSDLDTLIFKADEKITLNKITLDRYGYSSNDGITVWLEDQQWNKVTNEKSSTKDEIVLTFKKDYKEIAKNDELTIVVDVAAGTAAGTLGFKVVDVDCSAKDVDLSNYTPYQYDMVVYNGTAVTVEAKWKTRTYHYTEDDSYEIARIQVKAGAAAIDVNGFSFTNEASAGVLNAAGNAINLLDLADFIDEVTVTADGKKVDGVSYTAKKKDFKVSFDNVSIDSKKNSTFAINVTFKNLDELWKDIHLVLKSDSDINAVESKNQARVKIDTVPNANAFPVYTLNGGKITLSNVKLSKTIDAAQWSEDVVIAEGNIELGGEWIIFDDFTINVPKIVVAWADPDTTDTNTAVAAADVATYEAVKWSCTKNPWAATYTCAPKADVQAIDTLSVVVNGEEFEWTINATKTAFVFEDVEVSKSGKFQIVADLENDDDLQGKTTNITPATFAKAIFGAWATRVGEYSNSEEDVKTTDFVGSISISNIKVQAAKGSLSNDLTKKVEIVRGASAKKTVFDGTYTAKKWDVYLKEFGIKEITSPTPIATETDEDITFYLSVDWEAVAEITLDWTNDTEYFSNDVLVKKGESVKVKVEAVVYASDDATIVAAYAGPYKYELTLKGEDENGVEAGTDSADLVNIDFVEKGSITVSDDTTNPSANTIKLSESNMKLAEFKIKPSSNASDINLESLKLSLTPAALGTIAAPTLAVADVNKYLIVKVDGTEKDLDTVTALNNITLSDINENVPEEWVVVEVSYKAELPAWAYTLKVETANWKPQWTTFKKAVAPAIVSFTQQGNNDDTKYVATVDTNDSAYTVSDIKLCSDNTCAVAGQFVNFWVAATNYSDGTELREELSNLPNQVYHEYVEYTIHNTSDATVDGKVVKISKDDYKEFFKAGDTFLKIFKSKDN